MGRGRPVRRGRRHIDLNRSFSLRVEGCAFRDRYHACLGVDLEPRIVNRIGNGVTDVWIFRERGKSDLFTSPDIFGKGICGVINISHRTDIRLVDVGHSELESPGRSRAVARGSRHLNGNRCLGLRVEFRAFGNRYQPGFRVDIEPGIIDGIGDRIARIRIIRKGRQPNNGSRLGVFGETVGRNIRVDDIAYVLVDAVVVIVIVVVVVVVVVVVFFILVVVAQGRRPAIVKAAAGACSSTYCITVGFHAVATCREFLGIGIRSAPTRPGTACALSGISACGLICLNVPQSFTAAVAAAVTLGPLCRQTIASASFLLRACLAIVSRRLVLAFQIFRHGLKEIGDRRFTGFTSINVHTVIVAIAGTIGICVLSARTRSVGRDNGPRSPLAACGLLLACCLVGRLGLLVAAFRVSHVNALRLLYRPIHTAQD